MSPSGVYVRVSTPPLERLLRRAQRQEPLDDPAKPWSSVGCLLYPFSLNKGGYGAIRVEGKTLMAHRVAYEAESGPVPDGLELDHLCRVRCCIERRHLEAVTHRENDLRGMAPAILRHLAGVCVRGHEFVPGQQCRTCVNDRARERYAELRALGYPPSEAAILRHAKVG